MKKMILIMMLGMIFCRGIIQAEEIKKSTETVKQKLKLLWKKEFDGEIKSFAVFHDGSYIAVELNSSDYEKGVKKVEICLLDKEGKELWRKEENWAIKGFGNKSPILIVTNYRETKIFDIEGNLIWDKKVYGKPIISPNDKYIATIHTGIEGVTPRGLTVFDIKGNKLWNYNPMKFFNAIFITDDLIAVVKPPVCRLKGKKVVREAPGDVEILRVSDGRKLYTDTFEYLTVVFEVKLDYDMDKNVLKIFLGGYPKDGEVNIFLPIKIEIDNREIRRFRNQLLGNHVIETDLFVVKVVKITFEERKFNSVKELSEFKKSIFKTLPRYLTHMLRHPNLFKTTIAFYRKEK